MKGIKIILILFLILKINLIKSQEPINIFIKNGDDLCKINNYLIPFSNSTLPIILNIQNGNYYSTCKIIINNINNLTIIPNNNKNNNNNNDNNDNKNNNINLIDIEFDFKDSNIEFLEINFKNQNNSKINIESSSIILSDILIDNSTIKFNEIFQYIITATNTTTSYSLLLYSIFSQSETNISIKNGIIESNGYYNSNLQLFSDGIEDLTNSITIENIIIKGFSNSKLLIEANGNQLIITNITITNCNSIVFISTQSIQSITINGILLIGNKNFILIYINKLCNLNIKNLLTSCDNGVNKNSALIKSSEYIELNNNNNNNNTTNYQINISNSKLHCFGNSIFKSSEIKIENVSILTNPLFQIDDSFFILNNSDLNMKSSSIVSISYFKVLSDYFFQLENQSNLVIDNCTFTNSTSGMISAINKSKVLLSSIVINNIQLDNIPFFNINNYSQLVISNSSSSSSNQYNGVIIGLNIKKYYGTNSPLILSTSNSIINIESLELSEISFNSNNKNNNYNVIAIINLFSSSLYIKNSIISHCYSTDSIFNSNDGTDFLVENVKFFQNFIISSQQSTTRKHNRIYLVKGWVNSFSPILGTYKSNNIILNSIISEDNLGSFWFSTNDKNLISNNLSLINSRVPINYFFGSLFSKNITFSNLSLKNNYFLNYLFDIYYGDLVLFENVTYFNNKVISTQGKDNWPFLNRYMSPMDLTYSQFRFLNNNQLKFKNFNVIDNHFFSSMIYIYESNFIFEIGNIEFNKFYNYSRTSFLISQHSIINLNKINFISNNSTYNILFDSDSDISGGGSSGNNNIKGENEIFGLIYTFNSNFTMDSGILLWNDFPFSNGSIINHACLSSSVHSYTLSIINSQISNSISNFGTLHLEFSMDKNNQVLLKNNTFSNNFAKTGSVLYVIGFGNIGNYNQSIFYNSNSFQNNSCIFGNSIISSGIPKIFPIEKIIVYGGDQIEINFPFIDYFNNPIDYIPGVKNLSISILNPSNSPNRIDQVFIPPNVISGIGTIFYTFNVSKEVEFKIFFLNFQDLNPIKVNVIGCSPFTFPDKQKGCSFCLIGSTVKKRYYYDDDDLIEPCKICPDSLTCENGDVYSHVGYYLINQDVSLVYQCALDMCLENNQCSNKNNYGDLCFECIDNDGNQVVSKNGIQCCSKFIGWLIIPIILIYLIFGLILSYIKYTVFNSLLLVLIFNLKTFLKLVKKLGLNLKFIEKFKLQSKLIQILNTDTSNSIYRNQFKWWNVIEIIRSIIFSILSISMIFSPNYYMLIIVSIQITPKLSPTAKKDQEVNADYANHRFHKEYFEWNYKAIDYDHSHIET
ncbi:hypothetical protein DDB_G0289049 [Dictyostelium discoideum AX4]|uniref:Transmembrane protein n=1 Tax=Dictyostelium discoideum TaxID=44689 RepID=Q54I37_DICDI|nr:hypothetical protein DDB_G0289049 [Dictyostelium discoideum AX4]EAL62940.1 hypothetical protein DDB_G0289049 [Dictyostelium discoideum AX4]|eukprot:XP_636434.1 hypothetical protein DDB_G0289049 [Dictyostelium discoideum AX4]